MAERRRVLVVGLGTIAQTHLSVLAGRSDVTVVAGVDPFVGDAGEGLAIPVFESLTEALAAEPAPDLVVVATPTDTHVGLVHELVDRTDALVLSEKPLATTVGELTGLAEVADRVKVAHHFAFSPEVEWARLRVADAGWGPPTRALSVFHDPYAELPTSRAASLVSSWVDSGPNQLSVLAPFVGRCDLVSHADDGRRAVTVLAHDGGRTVLSSNWLAADSSKQTSLSYAGDREVRLDHTSLTVTVLEGGVVTEHVGYAGTASRKEAHYRGLYDALVADPADPRLGVPLATEIARLLEAAAAAPPARQRWSELG